MARFILWAILLYVLWRVGWRLLKGVFEGMGYQAPGAAAGGAGSVGLVKDPMCGTFVMPSKALTSGSGPDMRFFCSEKCRSEYAAKR